MKNIVHRPSQHVVKRKGMGRLLHPVAKRGSIGPANLVIGGVTGLMVGFLTTLLVIGALISIYPMAAPSWARPLVLATFVTVSIAVGSLIAIGTTLKEVDEIDGKALKQFKEEAEKAINSSYRDHSFQGSWMIEDGNGSSIDVAEESLRVISDEPEGGARSELRRRTLVRLATVQQAYCDSHDRLGTAPKDDIEKVRSEAVFAICREAALERTEILRIENEGYARNAGSAIEDMRMAVSGALVMGLPTTPKTMLPTTGTGRARIDRLVERAREALEINPDLVDANGARVDEAIGTHLPRLISKHAEIAKYGRLEDLATADDALDMGVELIRRSVEEGLRGLTHEKADALRTEIAFLKLRRGEDDETLRLPG